MSDKSIEALANKMAFDAVIRVLSSVEQFISLQEKLRRAMGDDAFPLVKQQIEKQLKEFARGVVAGYAQADNDLKEDA